MRFSRLFLAIPFVAFAGSFARGDDTEEFLKPDNWEGRADIWTLDSKARTIVGETKKDPGYNNFFCSKKQYGDFELTFKVQLRDGAGNSGVQIRSEQFGQDDKTKPYRVRGPQPDIGAQYWGSVYGEGVGGMMKASEAQKVKDVVKPKEFNDYSIVAKGNHITVKINGETMVDGDFPTTPNKKPMAAMGIIAFQAHAGFPKMRVEFMDIKFTDLSKK